MAKKQKTKKKMTAADYILIFGILIILIPCIALGYFLWQAQQEGDKAIFGKRVENERVAEISETQLDSIQTTVSQMASVQSAETTLKVSTMRIYVDTEDNMNVEDMMELVKGIYAAVDDKLPVGTYFTRNGSAREYDMEIHAYNSKDLIDTDRFIYVTLIKTSGADHYVIDNPSEARDEDLARELRGETQSESVIDGEEAGEAVESEDGEESGGE